MAGLQVHAPLSGEAVNKRRIVVTGMGVVTSLGHDVKQLYDQLLEGKSGIRPIEGFDTSHLPTRFAGEILGFHSNGYLSKKMERRLDNCIKFAMTSGKKALESAGLPITTEDMEGLNRLRCGVLIGTAFGGLMTYQEACEVVAKDQPRKMNPFCIPFAITNMSSALLAMDIGFMGPNYSISTACATGNYCIFSAAEHIRRGEADVMLAGGSDAAVIPTGLAGFVACKALSQRNDAPHAASRPWDQGRDGFVMGEGAGTIVLEELEHAQARGAPILAEYVGGSFTCDAHHMTEPSPDGAGVKLCLERALAQSGIDRDEINYVNAHATSTKAGDMAEYRAIREILPGSHLRMNATKSMLGHLLGAAGAVEAIAAIEAIRTGELHPTINLENPDEGVDMSVIVGGTKQHHDVGVALSNSFGFGGHNSCIMFRGFKE